MQVVLVGLIILLATLGNIAPLLVGYLRTPPGSVFLGTIHHPADYFYYLSQFAQGSYRWLTTIDLYTSEQLSPSFVGWSNVLLGRLFDLFGISPDVAYHISVVFFTAVLLLIAYRLSLVILGKKWPATLALFLFAIFHAFPVMREGMASYGDYWNNFAIPTVRLGAVPHQLLTAILSFASFLLLTGPVPVMTGSHLVMTALTSAALASLQPVLWALLTGSVLVTNLLARKKLASTFMYLLAGIIPVLYLNQLFSTAPFLQLKLWEAAQQTPFMLEHFITATGPIFLLAILFVPTFLSSRSPLRRFIFLFTSLSFFLFLSPIPRLIGITHVRFMSTLAILGVSIIAADGLYTWVFSRKTSLRVAGATVLLALIILLVPNHLKTITNNTDIDTSNAYYYIPRGDFDLLKQAGERSTPDDIFFVTWPFNVVFPGVTGRKSYHGHPLLTINSSKKDMEAANFLSQEFLKRYGITYVVTYPLPNLPNFLSPVTTGGSLIMYKVML
jgi:hypothetical protein